MKKIEIDANGNTAWAFVDGYINISSERERNLELLIVLL